MTNLGFWIKFDKPILQDYCLIVASDHLMKHQMPTLNLVTLERIILPFILMKFYYSNYLSFSNLLM